MKCEKCWKELNIENNPLCIEGFGEYHTFCNTKCGSNYLESLKPLQEAELRRQAEGESKLVAEQKLQESIDAEVATRMESVKADVIQEFKSREGKLNV